MASSLGQKAAVIGLGPFGLAALKNLLEEGFDAIGFERNDYIGGLWKAGDPSRTSVLKTTVANFSKERNAYTDFPFSQDTPTHPTAEQVYQYIQDYASYFKLHDHIRLSTTIVKIERSDADEAWAVHYESDGKKSIEVFGKLVMATGVNHDPDYASGFKDPEEYKDQNVVVVGLSNSGCDTAVTLCKVAKKVYLSHRNGARILPRKDANGRAADHQATVRLFKVAALLESISPALKNRIISNAIEKSMNKAFPNIDPTWNFLPAPPFTHSTPIVNDHIIDLLCNGKVANLSGIKEFTGPRSLVLTDGTVLDDIDAVVFCTGYRSNFSLLPDDANPTSGQTPEYDAAPYGSSVRRFARLYQGVFSPKYPDSLAFLGAYLIIVGFTGSDVVSQAIAQVFNGGFALPQKEEIERWCDRHYKWSVEQAKIGRAPIGLLKAVEVENWLNTACDNKLNEKLGWGIEGWWFWWQSRELYRLLLDGVDTGFKYRLFEGRRKAWAGAKDAIYEANGAKAL